VLANQRARLELSIYLAFEKRKSRFRVVCDGLGRLGFGSRVKRRHLTLCTNGYDWLMRQYSASVERGADL
jgi:hypothetical protein